MKSGMIRMAPALALTIGACATAFTLRSTQSPRSQNVNDQDRVEAGRIQASVREVDITPPPGLGLFGHGPEGRVSVGVLLRLRCQVFVLRKGEEAVALVPCDLGAMSLNLQRNVARRVWDAGARLGADRIFLMATHTHAGPAHYFMARNYSGLFASTVAGYDPAVEDFLAERIAAGIDSAYHTLESVTVRWVDGVGDGLTRNRSVGAYSANVAGANSANDGGTTPADAGTSDARVDPSIAALEIRSHPSGARLGVFAVFGMHPTAIANTNDLYHGDVFGYATRELEDKLRCIVGIANGIEGDVSPAWNYQAPREARRLGQALAQKIHRALDDDTVAAADSSLRRVYRELRFPGALLPPSAGGRQRLCDEPELGTPAPGGAEDGPTRYRIMEVFNEGVRDDSREGAFYCHSPRIPLDYGFRGHRGGYDFPAVAPIALIEVGGRVIATAPAELTTTVGLRIRQQIRSSAGTRCVVVGLTNEYMQYIATHEEYDAQHYEGASTLYGPDSATFITHHLVCLASHLGAPDPSAPLSCDLDQPSVNAVNEVELHPDPIVSLLRAPRDDPPMDFNARDLRVTRVTGIDGLRGAQIEWNGIPSGSWARRENMVVEVWEEGADAGGLIDDDRGRHLEIRFLGDVTDPDEPGRWRATWFPDEPDPVSVGRCRRYHFIVRGHGQLRSLTFDDPWSSEPCNDRGGER